MMAEGILIEGKSLEELEREITCGICQEHYTEPKILPCLHYYCKQCVLRLATRTGLAKPFSCPECRSEFVLPTGGIDELKTAFFVNRLKTTILTMERAHGQVEVKCELCCDSEEKAEAFCRQCAMFICKDCIRQHKKMKILLTHEVATLEDLKQGRAKPIIVKEPPAKMCPDHKEPLIVYCYDCVTLICHHCTAKDHRDHNFEFCIKEAPKTIEILLEKLQPLKNQKDSLIKAINSIQTIKQEVKEQQDSVANDIQALFEELHNLLDKRQQELLGQAADLGQKKLEKLSMQEKLSIASAEIQSVVDYTEQCVRHCTANEVMSMHTEIRRQIEQKIEEHSKSGRSLESEEEADIGVEVRCREALQQLIQTQANIIQLPVDPTKCTVTMEDDKNHKVNKLSTAVLVTRFFNKKISKRHHKVSYSFRSLYNNTRTQCKVDLTGAGQYSIQYTLTVRGRHELTVSVDGQQVAGSPFPVFVSIHPTQLGKPINTWSGIDCLSGITINSVGDILVCCYDGNIIKLDKYGGMRTLLKQKNRLNYLWKIEVDDKNIYSIDNDSNKILKCSHDGSNVQEVQIQHMKNGVCGLVLINGKVMISDYYTKGTVMVYDKELKYMRRIEHQHLGVVQALSADCHGNLYCADYANDMIHTFNNDGVFVRSFGYDEEGQKKVNNPCGLCVSGHYVYVCNYGSYNISVFTTEGVYVTSFGQCDGNEGDFISPHSVCVDKDGFVYVTDFHIGSVQCF